MAGTVRASRCSEYQICPARHDKASAAPKLHSRLCGTNLRDLYTVQGREPCLINPKDAATRNIADGDVVRVFNDRGQILAGAHLTDDVAAGVIVVSEGGWVRSGGSDEGQHIVQVRRR